MIKSIMEMFFHGKCKIISNISKNKFNWNGTDAAVFACKIYNKEVCQL